MDWVTLATLGIAVVGATLGIFNAWWMVRRDAVRLRVRLVTVFIFPGGERTYGVEVTNVGYVPVTLTEVAVRKGRFTGLRSVIASDYLNQVRLPLRMEPRTCVTVSAEPSIRRHIDQTRARWCSATTACGVTVIRRFKVR